MYKKYLPFILFIFGSTTVTAQHCHLDNSYFMAVDVRDAETNKMIKGLTLTICDSTGTPRTAKSNRDNAGRLSINVKSETLLFGFNHKRKWTGINGPFAFGVNCYMIQLYANNYFNRGAKDTDIILIEDRKGKYATKRIEFSDANIKQLCTDYQRQYQQDGIASFKITVKLDSVK